MMLFHQVNHLYKEEIKEVLKQSLVEHRLLHLATMTFVSLEQLFVSALLSKFLIISKDSPLLHKTAI